MKSSHFWVWVWAMENSVSTFPTFFLLAVTRRPTWLRCSARSGWSKFTATSFRRPVAASAVLMRRRVRFNYHIHCYTKILPLYLLLNPNVTSLFTVTLKYCIHCYNQILLLYSLLHLILPLSSLLDPNNICKLHRRVSIALDFPETISWQQIVDWMFLREAGMCQF